MCLGVWTLWYTPDCWQAFLITEESSRLLDISWELLVVCSFVAWMIQINWYTGAISSYNGIKGEQLGTSKFKCVLTSKGFWPTSGRRIESNAFDSVQKRWIYYLFDFLTIEDYKRLSLLQLGDPFSLFSVFTLWFQLIL